MAWESGLGYSQALRASMPAGLSTSAWSMSERETTPRRCWVSSTNTSLCTCGSTVFREGQSLWLQQLIRGKLNTAQGAKNISWEQLAMALTTQLAADLGIKAL